MFSCQRLEIGDEVAIKVLVQHVDGKALLNEARAAGMSNHPNICKVYDYFEENGTSYLVMEKLDGLDLQTLIEHKSAQADRFSFRLMFAIVRETALALQHAHRGVLHRDIKPANLFLTSLGEIKVLDFGIAKFVNLTINSDAHPCTEAYSSPELWVDGKYDTTNYDASNDIYSLGIIFYELFHLKQAFKGKPGQWKLNLSNDFNKAPAGFEELFAKWIAPKKSERFRNADELIAALDAIYPEDFNVKVEVQQEVMKIRSFVNRNSTLIEAPPTPIHRATTARTDNPWPVVGCFVFLIMAILSLEYISNAGKTENIHEETLARIRKQTQQRSIASPQENFPNLRE